jgi:putative tryptophan/tyrosine transport system substrate-binding protein
VETIDPVGGGFVETLSRPAGNATGFASYEFSIGGKWLELLKEIAPISKAGNHRARHAAVELAI